MEEFQSPKLMYILTHTFFWPNVANIGGPTKHARGCLGLFNILHYFNKLQSVNWPTIIIVIESIKTTSMEDVNTGVLEKIRNI